VGQIRAASGEKKSSRLRELGFEREEGMFGERTVPEKTPDARGRAVPLGGTALLSFQGSERGGIYRGWERGK